MAVRLRVQSGGPHSSVDGQFTQDNITPASPELALKYVASLNLWLPSRSELVGGSQSACVFLNSWTRAPCSPDGLLDECDEWIYMGQLRMVPCARHRDELNVWK